MEQKKYISFALPMLRLLYTHTHALDTILHYGIYRASLNIKANKAAAYKQLLYMSARNAEQVTTDLWQFAQDYIINIGYDDFDDFLNETMDGKDIIPEAVDDFIHFSAQYAEGIDENVMEWYRLYLAQEVVGVNLGSIPRTLQDGRVYSDIYGTGQVPVSLSVDTIFSYRERLTSEYDKVRLGMYLAIRSLCGNGVAITTSLAIKWRSVGARNEKEYREARRDKRIKAIVEKWHSSRYLYKQIIDDLISSKLIKEMPYWRNTCVTASIMEDKDFVEAVAAKMRNKNAAQKAKSAKSEKERLKDLLQRTLNSI